MISKQIRAKKKKLITTEPSLMDTSPGPDMNAQDVYDMQQKGRIEETLMSPEKINADVTNLDEEEEYSGVGISPAQKGRMSRLRSYLDNIDLDG